MDRLFRIDLYPHDWLLDTARLPPDERGVYIQLVCLIYGNRGPIPNDAKWIAGVSGCSTRLAKALVDKLVQKGFILVDSDGKLTQKRAENELKNKRKHLERSANGGRKTAENGRQSNDYNDMERSENDFPVPTPSPSPTPSPLSVQAPRGGAAYRGTTTGGFEQVGGLGVFSAQSFDIARHLTERQREEITRIAPGWSVQRLFDAYNGPIRDGTRAKPDRNPAGAFLKWLPHYTKGNRPS